MPSEPVWDEAAIEAVASALRPLAGDKVAKGWNADAAGYGLYDVMTDEWLPGQVFQPRLGDVRKAEYFAREAVAAYFAALDPRHRVLREATTMPAEDTEAACHQRRLHESEIAMQRPSLGSYTLTLDAADVDCIYALVATGSEGAVDNRLGFGVRQRTFDRIHDQVVRLGLPAPAAIRAALRAEGKYSVRAEPEWMPDGR